METNNQPVIEIEIKGEKAVLNTEFFLMMGFDEETAEDIMSFTRGLVKRYGL